MAKECVLELNKICINCGECDKCDLDADKVCNNCGKCISVDDEYAVIEIDEIRE